MKTIQKIMLAATVLFLAPTVLAKDKKNKEVTFTVERSIPASAARVWAIVGDDFGAISKSHPYIVSSDYIDGSLKGGEGVQRQCNLNDKGTKYVREKQLEWDPENMRFKVDLYQAGGLPIDKTWAVYKVIPVDENNCKLVMDLGVTTSPAFMAKIARGKFKKNLEDYMIAVEHHTLTGEVVTRDNFKEIKKLYK